jgi:hypothetical protein
MQRIHGHRTSQSMFVLSVAVALAGIANRAHAQTPNLALNKSVTRAHPTARRARTRRSGRLAPPECGHPSERRRV